MSVPNFFPTTIQAGDTVIFKKHFNDYSSVDWTLTYYLTDSQNVYSFSGVADGAGDFDITVVSTGTSKYQAGDYSYNGRVSKSGEVHTVDTGRVTVLSAYTAAIETRSQAKIMLDAIDSILLGRASKDADSYSIAGRSLTKMPIKDLLLLHDRYWYEYQAECEAALIASGQNQNNSILRIVMRSDR